MNTELNLVLVCVCNTELNLVLACACTTELKLVLARVCNTELNLVLVCVAGLKNKGPGELSHIDVLTNQPTMVDVQVL